MPPAETYAKLILPEQVMIQLVDENILPVRMSNVLFVITAFPDRKNDYHLGPFGTDSKGLATITQRQLEAEAAANVDTGVMDYSHISACSSWVEIRMLTDEEIERAVQARKNVWRTLLAGERDRWQSMEQLLTFYRNANNSRLHATNAALRVRWKGDASEYSYNFLVTSRSS